MLWWQWRAKLNNVPERVLKHLHKIVRRLHTQPRDQWIALQIGCASAIWTEIARHPPAVEFFLALGFKEADGQWELFEADAPTAEGRTHGEGPHNAAGCRAGSGSLEQ